MAIQLPSVIVPKSYADNLDPVEDTCDNYEVTITKTPSGDFLVTGKQRGLESLADDICIGDKKSVNAIMKTLAFR